MKKLFPYFFELAKRNPAISYVLLSIVAAVLTACSFTIYVQKNNSNSSIDADYSNSATADSTNFELKLPPYDLQ